MTYKSIFVVVLFLSNNVASLENERDNNTSDPDEVFDGVYSECFLSFSFACIQNRTLYYLNEINKLDEIPIFGDYVKFVRVSPPHAAPAGESGDLATQIDSAVDTFFEQHKMRVRTLGRDLDLTRTVDEFVGRKRRKGGGGGGGGGDGGHGDGGKKKMMMMAMMCMKMKMMVMLPAMMGVMGMMSFKGMMFSMMSFMMAKMMLLMKILEKKGGGADGGWSAGGGGAWMPAGGGGGSSDGYGGPGGGYNANGEWQSRSIPELHNIESGYRHSPLISYVNPYVRLHNITQEMKRLNIKENDTIGVRERRSIDSEVAIGDEDTGEVKKTEGVKDENTEETNEDENIKYEDVINEINVKNYDKSVKSRHKRGIMDLINYLTFLIKNRLFQTRNYPTFKYVNGVKYVYYPQNVLSKMKKTEESRMNKKKLEKMKETVKDVVEENPWE